jgi:hypothetical protein
VYSGIEVDLEVRRLSAEVRFRVARPRGGRPGAEDRFDRRRDVLASLGHQRREALPDRVADRRQVERRLVGVGLLGVVHRDLIRVGDSQEPALGATPRELPESGARDEAAS